MIKEGNKVTVHYTGKFEDGNVFDSSNGKDPIEFVVGQNQVIPGFEGAVMGLDKGGSTTVTVEPAQGYGEFREDLILSLPADQVPADAQVGANLQGQDPTGNMVNVTIKEINEKTVTLDANHPLAGKTLTFDIEVVDFA
jgi:peptidylprolyl isomerase